MENTTIPENYELIFSAEDQEIQNCMIYLQMKEQRKSLEEIGEFFGYKSRQGMAKRRDRWQEDGIMDKARRKYFIPKGEEINAAISRVMEEVPTMLDRMVKIVKLGREHNAIEAFKLLNDVIIQPEITKQPQQSGAELSYAERSSKGLHDPMLISLPAVTPAEPVPTPDHSSVPTYPDTVQVVVDPNESLDTLTLVSNHEQIMDMVHNT